MWFLRRKCKLRRRPFGTLYWDLFARPLKYYVPDVESVPFTYYRNLCSAKRSAAGLKANSHSQKWQVNPTLLKCGNSTDFTRKSWRDTCASLCLGFPWNLAKLSRSGNTGKDALSQRGNPEEAKSPPVSPVKYSCFFWEKVTAAGLFCLCTIAAPKGNVRVRDARKVFIKSVQKVKQYALLPQIFSFAVVGWPQE